MKIKPNRRGPGNVTVELGPNEDAIPGVATERRPLSQFRLTRILVPIDFSDCSKKALQYAVPFARQFNAELTLLHVVQRYSAFSPEVPMVDAPTDEEAQKELNRIVVEVPFNTAVREGEPYAEIVAAAKELASDLIILSTHGHTGMAHVFLGSTAEKVVRHAGCPVLIVREREHDFAD